MNSTCNFKLHPFTVVDLDTQENHATISNAIHKQTIIVGEISILLLLNALQPKPRVDLIILVAEAVGVGEDLVDEQFAFLLKMKFIITEDELSKDVALQVRLAQKKKWIHYGWNESFNYILRTLDAQFLDASSEGSLDALTKMRSYADVEEDSARCKKQCSDSTSLPLKNLEQLRETWIPEQILNWTLEEKILALSACAVGVKASHKPKWNGARLLRKLHPSGGARHPTETYLVLNRASSSLSSGVYHVQCFPLCLKKLEEVDKEDILKSLEPTFGCRVPFQIEGIMLFTSLFERNQFRYRESRTYRSVHMDVGHVMENIELLAGELKVKTFGVYAKHSSIISRITKTSALEEGLISAVYLG